MKVKMECDNLACKNKAKVSFKFKVYLEKSNGTITGKFCGKHVLPVFNQELKPIIQNVVKEYKLK